MRQVIEVKWPNGATMDQLGSFIYQVAQLGLTSVGTEKPSVDWTFKGNYIKAVRVTVETDELPNGMILLRDVGKNLWN